MKRIYTYLLYFLTGVTLTAFAAETGNKTAIMKAEYEATHVTSGKDGNPKSEVRKWILQIAPDKSYYYNPQTYFVDSLINDPNGRVVYDAVWDDALQEFMATGADAMKIIEEKGMMRQGQYKCHKNHKESMMTVWDNIGADIYRYSVPMTDLVWNLADSTKTILGYACQMAEADYHGRRWKAWFTSEVPVNDGPWQLYGLPGLIMEAMTADGEYLFQIKGLQTCEEPLKEPFEKDEIFKSNRLSFLRQKDYSHRNRSAHLSAITNGAVKVDADFKGNDDFMETDYHE